MALIKQAARVIDFYRHLDVNDDGKVTKAEFSSALPLLFECALKFSSVSSVLGTSRGLLVLGYKASRTTDLQ